MNNLKLLFGSMEYFLPHINDNSIEYSFRFHRLYRVQNYLLKKEPNLFSLLINDWAKDIYNTDIFIIFDSHYYREIASYIKSHNSNSKIYFYFWNIITDKNIHFFDEDLVDEFWTFDKEDARKYGINYNPQFYTRNITISKKSPDVDTFFLGREKNRRIIVDDINKRLLESGLNSEIHLIPDSETLYTYDLYLEELARTKSILDVVNPMQNGLTLRCMESLFFEKKLITNNLRISEYDFYNPQNIFILGRDDDKKLLEFVNSDYHAVDKSIVLNYDYNNWVKRFIKK